jgi:hypothetical protein
VKARHVKTTEEAEKVTGLLEQVRTLEKELEALRELGVADTRGLAQGQDAVRLEFCDEGPNSGATYFESTWNDVFAVIGKNCFYLPDDSGVTRALRAQLPVPLGVGLLSQRSFEMVKSQCFCLGLIRFVPHLVTEKLGRSSAKIRWELTELGRIKLGELIGVKRASA